MRSLVGAWLRQGVCLTSPEVKTERPTVNAQQGGGSMDLETWGWLGMALLVVSCAVPLLASWRDFRRRYAEMRERAAEYHASGNV